MSLSITSIVARFLPEELCLQSISPSPSNFLLHPAKGCRQRFHQTSWRHSYWRNASTWDRCQGDCLAVTKIRNQRLLGPRGTRPLLNPLSRTACRSGRIPDNWEQNCPWQQTQTVRKPVSGSDSRIPDSAGSSSLHGKSWR